MSARLDEFLVARGHYTSRARAQNAIKAGFVRVNNAVVLKPAHKVSGSDVVTAAGDVHPYVSRGGVKLAAALDAFGVNPHGIKCLDLGASTGGFTDVLLRRGAAKVYAVDVGRGQLHPSLKDNRVVNMEKTHANDLTATLIPDTIDLIVCDVSFISLKKALPPALSLTGNSAQLIALVKPQFEVGPEQIGKGGIVKPGRDNAGGVAEDIGDWIDGQAGWRFGGYIASPITGGDGNREFLLAASK